MKNVHFAKLIASTGMGICLWFPASALAQERVLAGPVAVPIEADQEIGEIVVTARKREESLQDTPIAISAFSGATLAERNVVAIDRLSQFTPSLQLYSSPTNSGVSNAAAYIRGVGQNDFSPGLDPGVGIYYDGVYLGRSIGGVLNLLDVDRVEVLKGPQGTLFGRNTIGGAISIVPKKPSPNAEGLARIRYGSDNQLNVEAVMNTPLSDSLFLRLTAASYQQDGYVTRITDGLDLGDQDTLAARAAVRWQPTETLTVDIAADVTRDRSNGPAQVLTGIEPVPTGAVSQVLVHNIFFSGVGLTPGGPNPFACFSSANATNPNCYNQQFIDPTGRTTQDTAPTFANNDVWGLAINIGWDISDHVQLRSISGYRAFDGSFAVDRDRSPLTITHVADVIEQEQLSQEFQLTGSAFADRLKWILGAYFFHEDGSDANTVDFSAVKVIETINFDVDSYALFAQATFDLTPKLSVTGGLRGTWDHKSYLPDDIFLALPLAPFGINFTCFEPVTKICAVGDRIVPATTVSVRNSKFVPMVNIAYKWTDDILTYASYSQGFKSGGVTQRVFPPEPSLPAFTPEYVDSYEVGLKVQAFADRLQVNVAGYFSEYSDQQILVSGPPRIGAFVSNVGGSEIKGFELELIAAPGDGWRISASAALTDARFVDLPPPNPDGSSRVPGITLNSRFENISKWTANGQITKKFRLQSATLTPRVEWIYRSSYFTNDNNFNVPVLFQGGFSLINAGFQIDLDDPRFSIEAGVDNVFDKRYKTGGSFQDGIGQVIQSFNRGRQWFISASYAF